MRIFQQTASIILLFLTSYIELCLANSHSLNELRRMDLERAGYEADDELSDGLDSDLPNFNSLGKGIMASNRHGASSDFIYLDAIGYYDDKLQQSWDQEDAFRADYLQGKVPIWDQTARVVGFNLLTGLRDSHYFGHDFPYDSKQIYLVVINQLSSENYRIAIWPAEEQETNSPYYPMVNRFGGHRQLIQTMVGKFKNFQRDDFSGRWFAGSVRLNENGKITARNYSASLHTEHSGPTQLVGKARLMFDIVLDSIFAEPRLSP